MNITIELSEAEHAVIVEHVADPDAVCRAALAAACEHSLIVAAQEVGNAATVAEMEVLAPKFESARKLTEGKRTPK